MRILVAIPTFESITPDTFKSVWDMDKCGHEVLFEFVRGYDCAQARNNIAQLALSIGADKVMMVDSDVVLPPDALREMLEVDELVVLGWYAHRDAYDGKTCLCRDGQRNYVDQIYADELRALADAGTRKLLVKGGGMGCALIDCRVFAMTAFPWFDWVTYGDRKSVLSEDLYFCSNCKKANIRIYAATAVGCGHFFRHMEDHRRR